LDTILGRLALFFSVDRGRRDGGEEEDEDEDERASERLSGREQTTRGERERETWKTQD